MRLRCSLPCLCRYARYIHRHPLVSLVTELLTREAGTQHNPPDTSSSWSSGPGSSSHVCVPTGISDRPNLNGRNGCYLEGVGGRGQVVYQSLCRQLGPWTPQIPTPDTPYPATTPPGPNDSDTHDSEDKHNHELANATHASEARRVPSPGLDQEGMVYSTPDGGTRPGTGQARNEVCGRGEQAGGQVLPPADTELQSFVCPPTPPGQLPGLLHASSGAIQQASGSEQPQQTQHTAVQPQATEAAQRAPHRPSEPALTPPQLVHSAPLWRSRRLPSCVTGVIVTHLAPGSAAATGPGAAQWPARQLVPPAAHQGVSASPVEPLAQQPSPAVTVPQSAACGLGAPSQNAMLSSGQGVEGAEAPPVAQQVQASGSQIHGHAQHAGRSPVRVLGVRHPAQGARGRPPAVPELEPLARLSRHSSAVAKTFSSRAYHPLEQGVQQ
jgi:hypothetical protein